MAADILSPQFYTYIYRDPRKNHEPFYVGKGQGSRCFKHLTGTSNVRFRNKLKALNNLDLLPQIEIWNTSCEGASWLLEILFIQKYGRLDLGTGTLCNKTNGGEGTSGYKLTDETKRKISDALTGRIVSEQAKINLRKALNGRKQKDHEKEAHKIAQKKVFDQNPHLKQQLIESGKKNFDIYLIDRKSKIDTRWLEALKIIQDEPKIHGWIGRVAEKMNITRAKVNIYVKRFKNL